jgi:hypothetical protein
MKGLFMKKYLLGFVITLLCITSYFAYDIIKVNLLRKELIDNLDQSSLEFIKENKQDLLKYPNINFQNQDLKDVYDDKFNDVTWSMVEILDKAEDYQHLFGELPKIENKGVKVPVNTYLMAYFSKELLGDEIVKSKLIDIEDIETITENVGVKAPYDIFNDYYGLIMTLFLNGEISNEEILEFHSKLEVFTASLQTRPSDVFRDSMPGLINQYTTYRSFELIRENILSLSVETNKDPNKKEFYRAVKSISNLMDAPLIPNYTIKNLQFIADSNANTFIIPNEFVTLIRSHGFDEAAAKDEFTDYLNKDNMVFNQTLESNEVYYIVSTNDFFNIEQIEIVYTFDNDYSQFLHGNDSKEVLEKRIRELGFETSYLNEYNITYLDNISDTQFQEYVDVIDETLTNYDEILMPIMISNKVNHYFSIEDGHYLTETGLMFDPMIDASDMLSDITFYVVDKITRDYHNVGGVAMSEGILITKDNLSREKTARNTIHHELMHQIDRFYNIRYNIRIQLNHSDFRYLDRRDLSTVDYFKTIRTENFSARDVLSRMDYGMTSHYAGVNKYEHLAELWADLLTDYDFYKDEIEEHEIFDENVEKLVTYMNEIIETVDGERLEDIEGILKFDRGYLGSEEDVVMNTEVSETEEVRFNRLEYNIKANHFVATIMASLPPELQIRSDEIITMIKASLAEHQEWYMEYLSKSAGEDLPYHENFGITEEEYEFILTLEDNKSLIEIDTISGSFEDLGDGKLVLECEDLEYLDGLVFDLEKNVITAEYGEFVYDHVIEASEEQKVTGPFNGGTWICEFDERPVFDNYEMGKAYGSYNLSIGMFVDSGELILHFEQKTYEDGIEHNGNEFVVVK